MTPFPLGFGGLGFDLAKPNPSLSWSSEIGCCADGVVDNPLAGAVDAATFGAWRERLPRTPLAEVAMRGVGNISYA